LTSNDLSPHFKAVLQEAPHWSYDLVPLFFLLLSFITVFYIKSKLKIFLLITISYLISDYLFCHWWETLKKAVTLQTDQTIITQ